MSWKRIAKKVAQFWWRERGEEKVSKIGGRRKAQADYQLEKKKEKDENN